MCKLFSRLCSLFVVFLLSFNAFCQEKKPKVFLVLSGGGAKGFAELPLLEAIENEGIKVDMVLGTSMGSLIGGLYASGYTPKQIKNILLSTDYLEMLNVQPAQNEKLIPEPFSCRKDLVTLSFTKGKIGSAPGIVGDQNLLMELDGFLSRVMHIDDFDELPIPFRAIATNVQTGEEIVFSGGSIVNAIRASISLPGVFTPVRISDNVYAMDGGIRNNMPARLARELGADIVIAMDVASVVDTDPTTLSDFGSVAAQIFNLIISYNAVEQHDLADVMLIPDLHKYSTVDFLHPKEIYACGQKCVDENIDKIRHIAEKLKKQGVDLYFPKYDREGIYLILEDPIIESITVKDISFIKSDVPHVRHFKDFVGKKFDSKLKERLSDTLYAYRKNYRFSSFSYNLRKGSKPGYCRLELLANHYDQKMNTFFLGGNACISVNNDKYKSKPSLYPNAIAGVRLFTPVETVISATYANTSDASVCIFPKIVKIDELKFGLDVGARAKYGSLEPRSNKVYYERNISRDRGADAHGAVRFVYSDIFSLQAGITYDWNWIKSTSESYRILANCVDMIYTTLQNDFTDLKGAQIELSFHNGLLLEENNLDDKKIYMGRFGFEKRFMFMKNWNSFGIDFGAGYNRYPYELNSGYFDFGGIEGMCGYSYSSYKRDFAMAGISARQKLGNVVGMPLYLVFQSKYAYSLDYDVCMTSDSPVDNDFDFNSGDYSGTFGAALYLALRTPVGNIVLGGGANTDKKWCVSIGLK